ncbi:MAG TPA: TetR/AcrR family transcriptional regulator [Acidimicrobiales bacterium]|nr:TetR/AcrR family transcriptional regulator [Acidimicrobiales bacterium]
MTVSAPRTARDRVREEMTAEILAVAGEHLGREGAAALSLRSIARDLGMAPSALYRYFDGRDALLNALILAAYESLAETAEAAADDAKSLEAPDAERFLVVPRAVRDWALGRPHEWGLIFGTPVPGYQAPEDTVVPYARIAAVMVRPVVEANEAGRLQPAPGGDVTAELRDAVAPVSKGLLPGMPVAKVVRVVQAWTTLIGIVSLEVFGHWRNTIGDPATLFEATVRDVAASIGLE